MADGSPARWHERAVTSPVESARQRALSQSLRFVEAALELLSEPDRTDLTVTEVVERSGVSLRTFYQRFDGKDEFMLAVLEESLRRGREIRAAEIDGVDDPAERLRDAITGILAPVPRAARARRAALAREHVRLAQLYPAEIQQLAEPAVEVFEREIARGIERGIFRDSDPRQLALMVFHLTSAHTTATLLETVDPRRTNLDPEAIWEFVRRALQP